MNWGKKLLWYEFTGGSKHCTPEALLLGGMRGKVKEDVVSGIYWINSIGNLKISLFWRNQEVFKYGYLFLRFYKVRIRRQLSWVLDPICSSFFIFCWRWKESRLFLTLLRYYFSDSFHSEMLNSCYQATTCRNKNRFWILVMLANISALVSQNCIFIDWVNHHPTP